MEGGLVMNFKESLTIKSDSEFEKRLQNHQPIYNPASIDEVDRLDTYLKQFKALAKEQPEEAKKIAFKRLQDSGIIDETGNLKPPYNGEKVNESDFTRGPQLIKKI